MKFLPLIMLALAVLFFLSACALPPFRMPSENKEFCLGKRRSTARRGRSTWGYFVASLFAAMGLTFVTPALAQDEDRGAWEIGSARIVQEYVLKGPDAANKILFSKMTGERVTEGVCSYRGAKFIVKRLVSTFADGKEVMNVVEVEDAGGEDGPNGALYYVVNSSRVVKAASGMPDSRGSKS